MPNITPPALAAVLVLLICGAAPSFAQWQPDGVAVGATSGEGRLVIGDGLAGCFIAWGSTAGGSEDVWLQHLTGGGGFALGWPGSGLPVVVRSDDQVLYGVVPDGAGGVLTLWYHAIDDMPTRADLFVQRIAGSGSVVPGWPAEGVRVLAPGHQDLASIAPDGSGGAFLAWLDDRDCPTQRYDVYAIRVQADGTIASGWPADGLPIAALPNNTVRLKVLSDGAGGAYLAWSEDRDELGALSVFGVRLHANGTLAEGWAPGGSRLAIVQALAGLAAAPAGGLYIWSTNPGSPVPGFDNQYFLHRIQPDGTVSPGWPASGLLICDAPPPRAATSMESDGEGGVLLSWYDYRPPYNTTCGEIFALRVRPDGTLAPGWTANGTLVSDPTNSSCEFSPYITNDGFGGAYLVWNQDGPSRVQHLTSSGLPAPGWPQHGLRLATSGAQRDPRIAADGEGGAIVVWSETCCGRVRVWAQKFVATGIVAVNLSLVSAVAASDHVRLEWYAADGAGLDATLKRRNERGAWQPIATLTADGTGRLRYEDREVTPGGRYGYRLSYFDGGDPRVTSETWVEIPAAFELALAGFHPNPAVGAPIVSFNLPRAGAGKLELFDLAGRRVAEEDLAGRAPGPHLVRMNSGSLAPGAYVMKLTHDGKSLASRGVIFR